MIYYSIPFDAQKNIGSYYNAFMRILPSEDDFACFIDRDAMFTTPDYGRQLDAIIAANPQCGLFTAVASRIGCRWQRAGDWQSDNMNDHFRIGAELQKQHAIKTEDVTHRAETDPMGGVLILIRKSTWQSVRGFDENGMLSADNDIHRKVAGTGGQVRLMPGVYLYHWYRAGEKRNIKHLETKTIYTAIFGGYDTLKEPKVINPEWNYMCFTDNPSLRSDHWKIIQVPTATPRLTARRVKILFDEYVKSDHVIWIDASIEISCDPDILLRSGEFLLMKHPDRDCIYQEAEICMKIGKDSMEVIQKHIGRYRGENYPAHAGMVATGIMYRRNTKQNREFCKLWFQEVERGSIRDQLSFNYVARKLNTTYSLMEFIPQPHFKLFRHTK